MAAEVPGDDLNLALLKELECPICFEYCVPPILMCTNGHNVCHKCVAKLTNCAVCKGDKPSIRNLFAEEMSLKVKIACPNVKHGCREKFNLVQLEQHLPNCQFKFDCRIRSSDGKKKCNWEGNSKEALVLHVKNRHPGNFVESNVVKLQFVINPEVTHGSVKLLATQGEFFWIVLYYISHTSSIHPYVYFVGMNEKASSFFCRFFFTTSNITRSLVYQSQCLCLNNVSTLEESSLPFHKDMIKYFTKSGALECEATILKDKDGRKKI